MSAEQRKEFADTRMRTETPDTRFRGLARIPAARRWMLRKFERAQSLATDTDLTERQRKAYAREARSMAARLKADGVLTDD